MRTLKDSTRDTDGPFVERTGTEKVDKDGAFLRLGVNLTTPSGEADDMLELSAFNAASKKGDNSLVRSESGTRNR